jgi:hypothetical protein
MPLLAWPFAIAERNNYRVPYVLATISSCPRFIRGAKVAKMKPSLLGVCQFVWNKRKPARTSKYINFGSTEFREMKQSQTGPNCDRNPETVAEHSGFVGCRWAPRKRKKKMGLNQIRLRIFSRFFNHILRNEPSKTFFRYDPFKSRQSDWRD